MKAVEEMTTAEKLQAMETLWDSLWSAQESIPAPEWHGSVLQDRADDLASGKATFSDWETVKKRLSEPSS